SSSVMKQAFILKKRLTPARIAILYGVLGVIWILVTEWVAGRWQDHILPDVRLFSGLSFIGLTFALLFLLSRMLERRLAHERAWYGELFASNPQPMWIYDLTTLKFLDVNRAAVLQYGYTRAEFLSFRLTDIRPPAEVPVLLKSLKDVRAWGDHSGIWRHRKKDGSEILVEVFSHRTNFLDRNSRMVLVQDVTHRLRTEQQLRDGEARFREMAENLGDVYYNYDLTDNRLLYVNENFARLWGYSLKEAYATRRPYFAGVHPEDLPSVVATDARKRRGEQTETEYRVVRPGGAVIWIHEQSRSLLDATGRVHRIVGTMRDITARRQVEAALRE